MPEAPVPFPQSAGPGRKYGEGTGTLVNAYCEVASGYPEWRPCAGLADFATTGFDTFRGGIDADGTLFAAVSGKVVKVTTSGTVTSLTGTLTGTDNVTWARNNNTTPDYVVVCDAGAFSVTSSAVSAFADVDLPSCNSCCSFNGYILFSTSGGELWSTGLNAVTVDALARVKCTANPDGLYRVTASGTLVYAWGASSIEVYQDAGTSPFPLARVGVIPVGLRGKWAIAGSGSGWDREQVFVAQDATVRALVGGLETKVLSTPDVTRDIESVVDVNELVAFTYVVSGNPFWVLTSSAWTWELNLATGFWNKRKSTSLNRWRGNNSVYFNSKWIVGDTQSQELLSISEATFKENGAAVEMLLESGAVKHFDRRIRVHSVAFDFSVGPAALSGTEDETSPRVSVSWSMDGGATWGTPIVGVMLGSAGQYTKKVRVNRIGITSHHGVRFRIASTSPVYKSLRGGVVSFEGLGPA